MQPSIELLGAVNNISQSIGFLLTRVEGYFHVQKLLEAAESRAARIRSNIRKLDPLLKLDGVQAEFLIEAAQDFEGIQTRLLAVQSKVISRARTFLASPELVVDLTSIVSDLTDQDAVVKVMGMIGSVNAEQRTGQSEQRSRMIEVSSKLNYISNVLSQLSVTEVKVEPVKTMLAEFCRETITEASVADISNHDIWDRFQSLDGGFNLSTGIGFFDGRLFEQASRHLKVAEKCGQVRSYYYLGMMYRFGWGSEKCDMTAVDYFKRGTDANDPPAITQLGDCYTLGIGVDKDPQLAVSYVERGAAGEDPYGMLFHAWNKLHGYYTNVNYTVAYQMSKEAVESGYDHAKSTLGTCYQHGLHVERDPVKAVKLWKESLGGEPFTCIFDIARAYELGIGVKCDLAKTAEWYKRGTELEPRKREFFHALYGLCLIRGRGAPKDVRKGWTEVMKSVQALNGVGFYVQGECYRFGYGVQQNISKAINCYQRATTAPIGQYGKILANFALGNMFESGEGFTKDITQAFEHYRFGADRLHTEAQWKVALSCETGAGIEQHTHRSVYYLRLAASGGHREAQVKAGKYYMKGKGIGRDLHSAKQLLRAAAESGNPEAKKLLRHVRTEILLRRLLPKRTVSTPEL